MYMYVYWLMEQMTHVFSVTFGMRTKKILFYLKIKATAHIFFYKHNLNSEGTDTLRPIESGS